MVKRAADDFEAIRSRIEELRRAPALQAQMPDWLEIDTLYYCTVPTDFAYVSNGVTFNFPSGDSQALKALDGEGRRLIHEWIADGKIINVRRQP